MLKLKMMSVHTLPPVVTSCTSALSVRREATTASAMHNAASPDWQTPLNGIYFTQREADHAKTTGSELGKEKAMRGR